MKSHQCSGIWIFFFPELEGYGFKTLHKFILCQNARYQSQYNLSNTDECILFVCFTSPTLDIFLSLNLLGIGFFFKHINKLAMINIPSSFIIEPRSLGVQPQLCFYQTSHTIQNFLPGLFHLQLEATELSSRDIPSLSPNQGTLILNVHAFPRLSFPLTLSFIFSPNIFLLILCTRH